MSQQSPPDVRRLKPIPGFPPAQSFAQYQYQLNQYQQQQHALTVQHKPQSMWKQYGATMGMGFAMGMFVGGSVGMLHAVMSKAPLDAAAFKRAAGGGLAFGVIFSVGSLIRPH